MSGVLSKTPAAQSHYIISLKGVHKMNQNFLKMSILIQVEVLSDWMAKFPRVGRKILRN